MKLASSLKRAKKQIFSERAERAQSATELYWTRRCKEEQTNGESSAFSLVPKEVLRNICWADERTKNKIQKKLLAVEKRKNVISRLNSHKLASGPISPGCEICIRGKWSCLYLGDQCTASCFFCPIFRNSKSFETKAERRVFSTPEEYTQYLKEFNFEGVSFSGGEPLLYYQKFLSYLTAIRRELPPALYVWFYTNGDLFTDEILKTLRSEGVDEIRIDLAASGFDLKRVVHAKRFFETVTVEIPIIPEQKGKLMTLMGPLRDLGVSFLNLHQLTLTPHNENALKKRNYSYSKGANIAALESELAALELLEEGHALPIQYCTAKYKSEYQTAHQRLRARPPNDSTFSVTQLGFWRQVDKDSDWISYYDPSSKKLISQFQIAPGAMKRVLKTSFLKNKMSLDSAINQFYSANETAKNEEIANLLKMAEFENVL